MTRSKTIKIRLTEAEHRRLKALAGKQGVSALLRTRALGPDRRERKLELLGLLTELARVRNLMACVAKNSVRRPPADQVLIVAQLVTVERELIKLRPG